MSNKIIEPIVNRKSVLAFDTKSVSLEQLNSLFEAARWAPSSYNEQPWKFFYASKDDNESFTKIINCLAPPNKEWAKNASVLIISTAKKELTLNGKLNSYAMHDVGLATANLLLQAQAMGLASHPMGGFSKDKARDVLNLSNDYDPVAAIAIGYHGDYELLSEDNKKREGMPRQRKPIDEVAMKV